MNQRAAPIRVILEGELTIGTVTAVKQRLTAAMAEQASLAGQGEPNKKPQNQDSMDPPIEVDLAGIEELDTAGLQLLLLAKRERQGRIRFVHHSVEVLRLLDLANLAATLGDPIVLPATDTATTDTHDTHDTQG